MTVLSIGLLGAGRIGKVHAQAVERTQQTRLVAVADAIAEPASEVAERYGAEVRSIEAIIGADDVDAVIIATPTDTHADLIEQAARAGKAIFCEKPIDLDVARVRACLAVVDEVGAHLMVGFNRRFDPNFRTAREQIDHGAIGDVEMVTIISRDPGPPPVSYMERSGGLFKDMTIHDFDMARFVTGSEVVEVYAKGDCRVDPAIGAAGDLDTVVVLLTHADGTLTTIENCRQAAYGYDQRVEAFGSLGISSSENLLDNYAITRTASGGHTAKVPYFFLDRYIPSYLAQWKSFVAAVSSGSETEVTAIDGRAPLVIGLAAWRSVREERPVLTSEFD